MRSDTGKGSYDQNQRHDLTLGQAFGPAPNQIVTENGDGVSALAADVAEYPLHPRSTLRPHGVLNGPVNRRISTHCISELMCSLLRKEW